MASSIARRLAGAVLVTIGWLAVGAGMLFLAYNGYVEDNGSPPLRTLDEAIPLGVLGLLLIGWAATVETAPGASLRPRLLARLRAPGALAALIAVGLLARAGIVGFIAAVVLVGAAAGVSVVALMRRRH